MTKVRMLKSVGAFGHAFNIGAEYELEPKVAREWIKQSLAEPASVKRSSDGVERATLVDALYESRVRRA